MAPAKKKTEEAVVTEEKVAKKAPAKKTTKKATAPVEETAEKETTKKTTAKKASTKKTTKKAEEVKPEVVEERKFAAPSLESFDIILAPIVTEKTMKMQQEENKITLKVSTKANKAQVKIAVQQIFNVRVDDVKIINVAAATKRVGRYEGTVPAYKKAIVSVNKADKINVLDDGE
jgi:large subunit ribosomal protein L23